jgi:hypothetical protein
MMSDKSFSINMNSSKAKKLMNNMKSLVALIIDERSLLGAKNIGMMENHCQSCALTGRITTKNWGGIPVVVIVGDDYQLPSIEVGAFYAEDKLYRENMAKNKRMTDAERVCTINGFKQFIDLGKQAIFLKGSKRTQDDETTLHRMLTSSRCENHFDTLSDEDTEVLMQLHLQDMNIKYTSNDQQHLKENGICLFAKKEPRNIHNAEMLYTVSRTNKNPVAIIKSITTKNGIRHTYNDHYDNDRTPSSTLLCNGCLVQLTGWNACPEWGLYHGSIGKIIDIIFHENETPNNNDLPQYIIVNFPQYKGPIFDKNNPKYVPITTRETTFCKKEYCTCTRKYMPLTLAFGKTIHTFQGQNVGPVNKGQTENAIQYIIVDPGERGFEGNNPGLFYTILSRITTLGNKLKDMDPAIYFTGKNMNKNRISFLALDKKNKPYKKAEKRMNWVNYLKRNKITKNLSMIDQNIIFNWAKTTKISKERHYTLFNI